MQTDLDKIVKDRFNQIKTLHLREDKSEKIHDDNLDSS